MLPKLNYLVAVAAHFIRKQTIFVSITFLYDSYFCVGTSSQLHFTDLLTFHSTWIQVQSNNQCCESLGAFQQEEGDHITYTTGLLAAKCRMLKHYAQMYPNIAPMVSKAEGIVHYSTNLLFRAVYTTQDWQWKRCKSKTKRVLMQKCLWTSVLHPNQLKNSNKRSQHHNQLPNPTPTPIYVREQTEWLKKNMSVIARVERKHWWQKM